MFLKLRDLKIKRGILKYVTFKVELTKQNMNSQSKICPRFYSPLTRKGIKKYPDNFGSDLYPIPCKRFEKRYFIMMFTQHRQLFTFRSAIRTLLSPLMKVDAKEFG